MKRSSNVVADTIAELNNGLDKAQVLLRLKDWRDRIHCLYDEIRRGLGSGYFYDRSGKHATQEEVVQRAGLMLSEIPLIDILRIEDPHRRDVAVIQPRYLWMIGANGRLDLLIPSKTGIGFRHFMLIDISVPMTGDADWRMVSPAERLDQPRFTVDRLRELIE